MMPIMNDGVLWPSHNEVHGTQPIDSYHLQAGCELPLCCIYADVCVHQCR